MSWSTFPSDCAQFMQFLLNCYPPGLRYAGATESARAVSAAKFADGVAHVYPQLHAFAREGRRGEFCWTLAYLSNQTLLPLLVEKYPYLYRAVCATLEGAGFVLRAGVREEEVIRKFYDITKPGSDYNRLACLLLDNWAKPACPRDDQGPSPIDPAADS